MRVDQKRYMKVGALIGLLVAAGCSFVDIAIRAISANWPTLRITPWSDAILFLFWPPSIVLNGGAGPAAFVLSVAFNAGLYAVYGLAIWKWRHRSLH